MCIPLGYLFGWFTSGPFVYFGWLSAGSELLQAAQLPHPEEPVAQVAGLLEQVRQLHGLA
jgi:hypothetical protein